MKATGQKDNPRKHGARYPWDEWFKAAETRLDLIRGRDFIGMVHGMAQTVRQAAFRAGVNIHVFLELDRLIITSDEELANRLRKELKNRNR